MAATVGTHILIDASDCDNPLLSDLDGLERLLRDAADASNCDVLETVKKQAKPRRKGNGATLGVLLGLGDSHAIIHTYPASGRWIADIFCCGQRTKPAEGAAILRQTLGGLVHVTRIERGR